MTAAEKEIVQAIKEANGREFNRIYLSKKLFLSLKGLDNRLKRMYLKYDVKGLPGLVLKVMRDEL